MYDSVRSIDELSATAMTVSIKSVSIVDIEALNSRDEVREQTMLEIDRRREVFTQRDEQDRAEAQKIATGKTDAPTDEKNSEQQPPPPYP